MVQECGKVPKVILMLDNGNSARLMVMAYILGLIMIVIKASLKNHLNMARDFRSLITEIFIRAIMHMANLRDLANIIGLMVAILRVYSKTVPEMDREFGKRDLEIVINIKESILMIESLVLASLHGQVETHIKEIMKMTRETVLVKCIGQMEASIKANGKMGSNMEWDKYMCQAKE